MTKSEKRHFKIYSNRHIKGEENNYVRLFDLIEKQKIYDEERIKQALSSSGFVKRLDVVKRYLFDLILEALTIFYNRSDLSFQVRLSINKALVLQKKGLVKEARLLLDKIGLVAEVNNLYYLELDIMHSHAMMTNSTDERKAIREKVEKKIDEIKNNYEYLRIKLSLEELMYKYGKTPPSELVSDFEKILEDPLMRSAKQAITLNSSSIYYDVKKKYYQLVDDHKKEKKFALKLKKLWDDHPKHIRLYFTFYSELVADLATSLARLKQYPKALEVLECLESLAEDMKININKAVSESLMHFLVKTRLWVYNRSGNSEKALELIAGIESDIKESKEAGSKFWAPLYFSMSVSCFIAQDHRNALYWINEILIDLKGNVRHDLQAMTRMLFLIIHLDLENNELLEYRTVSTYRFLLKKGGLNTFEKKMIRFLKDNNYKDTRALNKAFSELKLELEVVVNKDPVIWANLDLFDLLTWLEAKVKKKSMLEVIKSKALNYSE